VAPTPYGNTSFGHDPYHAPVTRRPRKWPYVLIAAAVVLTGAGVGGAIYLGSEDPFPEEAASLLISEEDLTPGWYLSEDADESLPDEYDREFDNSTSSLARCLELGSAVDYREGDAFERSVGYEYSGKLVGSEVWVFDSSTEADDAFNRFTSQNGIACWDAFVKEIMQIYARGFEIGAELRQGTASVAPIEPATVYEGVVPGIASVQSLYSIQHAGAAVANTLFEFIPVRSGSYVVLYSRIVLLTEDVGEQVLQDAEESYTSVLQNVLRRNDIL
jgi:hypothetical protein